MAPDQMVERNPTILPPHDGSGGLFIGLTLNCSGFNNTTETPPVLQPNESSYEGSHTIGGLYACPKLFTV